MAYGEPLAVLNPCPPGLIEKKLRACGCTSGRLLDVGCGRAATLRHLASVFPDMKLYGLDLQAPKMMPDERISICSGSAAHLPYPDACMAAILCECSYSLFAQPERCAAEFARVLCPGGLLLLSDLYAAQTGATNQRESALVRSIYPAAVLEAKFSACGFVLTEFEDRTADLTEMAARMIWDGSLCNCLDAETAALLRTCRPRYGMWSFTKRKEK